MINTFNLELLERIVKWSVWYNYLWLHYQNENIHKRAKVDAWPKEQLSSAILWYVQTVASQSFPI